MTDPQARPVIFIWVVVAVFVILLASFVVGALRRPPVADRSITPPHPIVIGDTLVGPAHVTLDATNPLAWTYFDFSRNSAVTAPGPLDWDIAVQRFHIIANGGAGFAGRGGIAALGLVALDSVAEAPDTGYALTTADSTNAAAARWYDYGYTTHLLQTKGQTFAVRTADGKYAAMSVENYYCTEARPGCFTLRYLYQGDGSRRLRKPKTENRTP